MFLRVRGWQKLVSQLNAFCDRFVVGAGTIAAEIILVQCVELSPIFAPAEGILEAFVLRREYTARFLLNRSFIISETHENQLYLLHKSTSHTALSISALWW